MQCQSCINNSTVKEICKSFPIKSASGKKKAEIQGWKQKLSTKNEKENKQKKKKHLEDAFKLLGNGNYNNLDQTCMEIHQQSFVDVLNERLINLPFEKKLTSAEKKERRRAIKRKMKAEIEDTKKISSVER